MTSSSYIYKCMRDSSSLPKPFHPPVRGRGATENPGGRFERHATEIDADAYETSRQSEEIDCSGEMQLTTQTFRDTSKTILSTNDSPDLAMDMTINPYRGCEHGCIYCYARPTHEYLGHSVGIDFETKIYIKDDAARLLSEKLQSPGWQPQVINFSGVTDAYQPLEKKLRITRQCLEVLRDFRNPAAIITKNQLVTRDLDLFSELRAFKCIKVFISITTLDGSLARTMEPRASQPSLRLRAVETLAQAGIPVGVILGPVIPGLTDHEIPQILKAAAEAGAQSAHYTMIRLPYGVKTIFQSWLETNYPDRAQKVLNRIRDVRGGALNDANFGTRMTGEGVIAEQIAHVFTLAKRSMACTDPEPRPCRPSFSSAMPAAHNLAFSHKKNICTPPVRPPYFTGASGL